jgi:hypothetical protein
VVRVTSGGQITLEASRVSQVLPVRPELSEYEKICHGYPDTVEGQWALAEWCREHKLTPQREVHLQRIIELDPNHAEARRALGYSQVDGQWQKRDDVMASRGYVRYKGRWRTPQEIELLENERKQELAVKDWCQKVERWRTWLQGDRAETARQSILAINDPTAVKALSMGLKNEATTNAQGLFVETLAKIGTPPALKALAVAAIEQPGEETRLTCLDYLAKTKDAEVVGYFVKQLQSKDNHIVNLAGVALGRMKDPSTVGPLIAALVTTHQFKVSQGSPGSISSTFGTGGAAKGSMGMTAGGGANIVTRQIPNQSVLDALIAITGQNFNFDQRAWKTWFASQKRADKPARNAKTAEK